MKRRKHLEWFALAVTVALLLLAGPASASGGVIHYWGNEVTEPQLPPHEPVVTPLPGGRWQYDGLLGATCYMADEDVAMDLISGCWSFVYSAIEEPSGVMKCWGKVAASPRFAVGGDEGWWEGTFHGVLVPNDDGTYDATVNGMNEGHGTLAGWSMKHQEKWRADAEDAYTFSGHFKPPQGWVPEQ